RAANGTFSRSVAAPSASSVAPAFAHVLFHGDRSRGGSARRSPTKFNLIVRDWRRVGDARRKSARAACAHRAASFSSTSVPPVSVTSFDNAPSPTPPSPMASRWSRTYLRRIASPRAAASGTSALASVRRTNCVGGAGSAEAVTAAIAARSSVGPDGAAPAGGRVSLATSAARRPRLHHETSAANEPTLTRSFGGSERSSPTAASAAARQRLPAPPARAAFIDPLLSQRNTPCAAG